MRLTCPACGAVASLEAWLMDEGARQTLVVILNLPPEVAPLVPRYLGLFRDPKSKRGLAWAKAHRLVTELFEGVHSQEVAWKQKPARHTTWAMWAGGIQEVLDKADKRQLELPLESHGYLKAIVYGLADKADAQAEAQRETDRRSGPRPPEPPSLPEGVDMEKSAAQGRELLERLRQGKAVGDEDV